MAERAHRIGGATTLESSAMGGTKMTCVVGEHGVTMWVIGHAPGPSSGEDGAWAKAGSDSPVGELIAN